MLTFSGAESAAAHKSDGGGDGSVIHISDIPKEIEDDAIAWRS